VDPETTVWQLVVQAQEEMGDMQTAPKDSETLRCGFSPIGIRPCPYWDPSHADQKEGGGHLLVVWLRTQTDTRTPVRGVQGLETGAAGTEEKDWKAQREVAGKGR
jgi:hypothetical protein